MIYVSGRGKMGKMAIPLIIGFKISGVIVAAIAALKVLIMKTIAFSSLALLASAGVAAKYVYDKTQHKHAEGAQQVTPYYYAPVQVSSFSFFWPQSTAPAILAPLQAN